MPKAKDYRCNICEGEVDSEQYLINHFHRDHPNDGWTLWDSIGRTGYPFADAVVSKFRAEASSLRNEVIELRRTNESLSKNFSEQGNRLREALVDLELVRRIVNTR
jgi:hypothetical protein